MTNGWPTAAGCRTRTSSTKKVNERPNDLVVKLTVRDPNWNNGALFALIELASILR